MSDKIPFKNFFESYDTCKCRNTKCKDRFSCFRYMSKPIKNWQAYFIGQRKQEDKSCKDFAPLYIYRDKNGKNLMLHEIDDKYLMKIIINFYHDMFVDKKYNDIKFKFLKEFEKEAKKRKLIEFVPITFVEGEIW